jgi:general secretion pathway protein D
VLAGLINNEDRNTVQGVPYASDMPVLGRLFRTESTRGVKSEIVLLVTPHIVRNVARPDLVRPQFSSGTEAVPGAAPLRIGNAGRLVYSAGTGGPTVSAAPATSAGPELQVAVTAPAEAKIGSEISLAMSLPAGSDAATASVQVTYDPAVLKPIGIAPAPGSLSAPDQAQLVVDVASSGVAGLPPTPTQVRFQVIAPAPTSTELDLLVQRSSRKVNIPRTLNVAVVK